MAVAVNVTSRSASHKTVDIYGTIVLTGSYPASGDALPASTFKAGTSKKPHIVNIQGKTGQFYTYNAETEKIQIFVAGVELTPAAYAAAILNDVIRFEAVFPKFG